MAEETHVRAVRAGAGDVAPTAPHATPPDGSDGKKHRKSGPERFWDRRRVSIALVLSLSAFGWVLGWLVVRRGRLGAAIVAHMTFNALATVQIFASARH